jgi:phosphinothricin acetyltransferase
MEITVRPAECADLSAMLEIYNDAVLHTTASADLEPRTFESHTVWYQEHKRDGYPVFVAATREGQVVGWSSLSQYRERYGYRFTAEDSVYIHPAWRGRGIGKLLIPPLIEAGRAQGLHVLLAGITADNEASLRLHARFGFEPVAHFHETIHKFGRWLDLVYMERIL